MTDKRTKKRRPKKTKRLDKIGDKVSKLEKQADDEIIESVVGKIVTFKRNTIDRKPRSFKVTAAKMAKKSKNFGKMIQLKTGKDGVYAIPVSFIQRIGAK